MTAERISVVIADDHPVYRRGLARAIAERPDLVLSGEAEDGRSALALIQDIVPDVALLDIAMPHLDGLQVLNAIQRDRCPTAVLLLSGSIEHDNAYDAVAAGATGYLLKTAEHETICDAIRSVARGETVLSQDLQRSLAEGIRSREVDPRPLLSGRELAILKMTAAGLGAAAIAEELHLSVATIRTHIQNGYHKLGVSDRAAAVAAGMRLGLIE